LSFRPFFEIFYGESRVCCAVCVVFFCKKNNRRSRRLLQTSYDFISNHASVSSHGTKIGLVEFDAFRATTSLSLLTAKSHRNPHGTTYTALTAHNKLRTSFYPYNSKTTAHDNFRTSRIRKLLSTSSEPMKPKTPDSRNKKHSAIPKTLSPLSYMIIKIISQ